MFNPFPNKPWFSRVCTTSLNFENSEGKGEIALNKQFLLFPPVFSTHLENFLPFSSYSHLHTPPVWKSLKCDVCERDVKLDIMFL